MPQMNEMKERKMTQEKMDLKKFPLSIFRTEILNPALNEQLQCSLSAGFRS